MKKAKRRLAALLITCVCAVVFIFSPLFPLVRSLAVMGVYGKYHAERSLLAEENISLYIPGGLSTTQADWYPFPITFVADESYSAAAGDPNARLTILYNFPAFDYTRGCSRLYDPASPYYNGFYGAWLVRDGSGTRLAAKTALENTVANVAAFDFFTLVLEDFGLKQADRVFDFTVTDRTQNIFFAGYPSWTRLEAEFTINGAAHNKRPGVRSYLQYGAPNFGPVAEEFAPVDMHGIVCGRYFPEWDITVCFYVMAADAEVCRVCEDQFLSKSVLEAST